MKNSEKWKSPQKKLTLKCAKGVFHLYLNTYMGFCGCEDKKYNPTLCEDKRECFKIEKNYHKL